MATYDQIHAASKDRWLQSLPEEVYDLSKTSHLVRFLDTLCGEAGVGKMRKHSMLKRLQTTLEETRYTDLDRIYSGVFGLRRLVDEQYPYRETDLLTWTQKQEMETKDASYRARIWKYMLSFQYGGTREGIRLASEAATGLPCEVVTAAEYYRSRNVQHGAKLKVSIGVNPSDFLYYEDWAIFNPSIIDPDDPQLVPLPGIDIDDPYATWRYSDNAAAIEDVELHEGKRFRSAEQALMDAEAAVLDTDYDDMLAGQYASSVISSAAAELDKRTERARTARQSVADRWTRQDEQGETIYEPVVAYVNSIEEQALSDEFDYDALFDDIDSLPFMQQPSAKSVLDKYDVAHTAFMAYMSAQDEYGDIQSRGIEAKARLDAVSEASSERDYRYTRYREALVKQLVKKELFWDEGRLLASLGSNGALDMDWNRKVADYNEYIVVVNVSSGNVLANRTFVLLDGFYINTGEFKYDPIGYAEERGDMPSEDWASQEELVNYDEMDDVAISTYVYRPQGFWTPSEWIDVWYSGKALYIEPSEWGENQESDIVRKLDDDRIRSFYDVTRRIRPVDARITLKRKGELAEELHIDAYDKVRAHVNEVRASSSWWNVVKYVTGRVDWDYVKHPSMWVEPGVRKEAPRQPLVNSQEEQEDFTFMVQNVKSSSEHVGAYGPWQQRLFPNLVGQEQIMTADSAIARTTTSVLTSSFYGGDDVTGWSYPIEYATERLRAYSEDARASRWWSSVEGESGESEWLVIEFRRSVPLNRIKANVCRKPITMTVQASSSVDEDGEWIWNDITTSDGFPITFQQSTWGGESIAGSMMSVEFTFPILQAMAVRFTFERRYIPYFERITDDGALLERWFPFSIEAGDISFYYDIRYKEDFRPSTYMDEYGNLVETELRETSPDTICDNNINSYWVSRPNLGEDAVEWLVLDVRDEDGKASRINYLDIYPIYGGCQMNIYSCDEDEPVNWKPYSGTYELKHDRVNLPHRKAKWMKLEFTHLCAIPYTMVFDDVRVASERFPYSLRRHFDVQDRDNFEQTVGGKLLRTANFAYGDLKDAYSDLGIQGAYYSIDAVLDGISSGEWDSGYIDSDFARAPFSQWHEPWFDGSVVKEERLVSESLVEFDNVNFRRTQYMFRDEGPHEYEHVSDIRRQGIAYVVGIRELQFGYDNDMWLIQPDETLMLPTADFRYLHNLDGWALNNDEQLHPYDPGRLNSFETNDMRTTLAFRSFDFAVNQTPPTEAFEHPSDMATAWHGYGGTETYRSSFGVSGKVLTAKGDYDQLAIESEPTLVKARSIGSFRVDVFPLEDSTWTVECLDSFDQQVFKMKYELNERQWSTLGTVFNPQPGGGWWNEDYDFRIEIPLVGPLGVGENVFVTTIDIGALKRHNIVRGDLNDVRLVYYDGTRSREIDMDITGDREIWFNVQQDLGDGERSIGAYDYSSRRFTGKYYLYFGNLLEESEAKRNWQDMYTLESGIEFGEETLFSSVGALCDDEDSWVEVPYLLSSEEGFVTFEYTPLTTPAIIGSYDEGVSERRVLLDYEDDDKTVRIYTNGGQLLVEITDTTTNYFTSTYASTELYNFVRNHTSRVAVWWGKKGSAPVNMTKVVDGEYVVGDEYEHSSRRFIGAAVSLGSEWWNMPNIHNVYGKDKFEDDGDDSVTASF